MDLEKQLEPTTRKFWEKLVKQGGKPLYELSIEEARSVLLKVQDLPVELPDVEIEDHLLPVGSGNQVSVRIFRPSHHQEILPIIMYFHGGGWVLGDKTTHHRLAADLAAGTKAAVVFVNYTPSPEAKYPTSIEEAYAATEYMAKHGKDFNLDGKRLALAGDSVGGNMVAAVTLLAKERKSPPICYQVLFYPVTDADFNTPSYQAFAQGPWLTKKAMEWFWHHYLPDPAERKKSTASPLQATLEELKGLPPALILTDENDVLRDEGEAYAHKLSEAGVKVTAKRYLATIHDFVLLNALVETPASKDAIATACAHLQKALQI